ncbi:hypothetical protein [Tahibacter amnicola]|uniref:Uncharacterized protein n=1 Tax=Tahibacter amnicola TaxID=2976241 RepID=A0ABY6BE72_9GAMM|nr:hypothetical protein [Tahibacter amnicola]UXI67891.1 hypothetical protein N4264_24700 [Tahibacter amnicola]
MAYQQWLADQQGSVWLADDATVLYVGADLQERNTTYGIQASLPQYLMIGQEGDRAYLLEARAGAPVHSVDLGSLMVEDFRLVSPDFATWQQGGFALPPEKAASPLPMRAPIYVDGVPAGDVAALGRIRKLLNAQWPMGQLRAMLAAQPILAEASGFPFRIRGALASEPALASYLFYGKGGKLKRIRP